jgi:LPXTG-site transpeptidase (sortase) family protein
MARNQPIKRWSYLFLGRWLFLLTCAAVLCAGIWFAYRWYTTANQPPLSPPPVAAVANPSVDEAPIPQAAIDTYRVPATHPRYISIPALGVTNARVVPVGLTRDNALDTPRNIGDTAWYTKSAYPGQGYGAVLIDGHNGGISRNGIFFNLDKLKTGDKIIIERGDGKTITYDVVEDITESLQDPNTTGMKRLMTPDDPTKEGLGLITCAGNYVPSSHLFNERILVRAVAE